MRIKLKIISGSMRGRIINITKKDNLRPVLTRVRQTIFDILFNYINIDKTKVLDVCCGSGIFGIESISRGSSKAYFLEINKHICEELKTNCINLGIFDKCKIYNKNALTPPTGEIMDIIFIDLPYTSNFLVTKIIRRLTEKQWIDENTIIILPLDKNFKHKLEEKYSILRQTIISSTIIFFLQLQISETIIENSVLL
jgi:16S rRNA (guanine966-N2)-methyltransferase